jgi:hypothetical protein
VYNEPLAIVAVRFFNPDRVPEESTIENTPARTGCTEFVGD